MKPTVVRRPAILAAFITAVLVSAQMASAADQAKRPNFLFLYTDDQRWDALSVVQREMGERARFPWFQTPNLDRLAADGVRFRNAFVVMSLCAPSRAAFLTSRYNHFNGIANNHTPFPTNQVTWATQLRAAGYSTAYIGKWHMDSQRGQRPGFDYSASFIAHARYLDAPFEINGVETATRGWVDDVSTDFALGFLRRSRDNPWAMAVGFKTPHGPFEPPARWADKFPDGWLRPVPNLSSLPPFPDMGNPNPPPAAPHGPPGALQANLNYFRCLAAVDENVGRLLRALDELGLAENTMVIYASDNGFYLREHGLGDKRSAYDESIRIPLLVRYPKLGGRGRVIDEMALNIDLAPTLLDFAGVPVPSEMQGRSWRRLLEGQNVEWRQSFFYEYFWEPQKGNTTPAMTAVRTSSAKLIKYKDHEEWTELFDLARDPYETRNLHREPSAANLRQDLENEYARQKAAVGYVWPEYADDPEKQRLPNPLNAWVLDYHFDKDEGEKVTDASGRGNHGMAKGTALTAGREDRRACRFDGLGYIDVPKSPSLNPAVRSWTVDVTFNSSMPAGVVLAHGGASFGYCLALEDGKPLFAVVGEQTATRLAATQTVTGRWTTVRACISNDSVLLFVDGEPAGRVWLKTPISRMPNDGLQIGADLGSAVLGKARPSPFTGLMESVRIFSGEAPQP